MTKPRRASEDLKEEFTLLDDLQRELSKQPSSPERAESLKKLSALEHELQGLQSQKAPSKPQEPPEKAPSFLERSLPWLFAAVIAAAIFEGLRAIWTSEHCWSQRSKFHCVFGDTAQWEGVAITAMALFVAVIVIFPSTHRKSVLIPLGLCVYALVMVSLLV